MLRLCILLLLVTSIHTVYAEDKDAEVAETREVEEIQEETFRELDLLEKLDDVLASKVKVLKFSWYLCIVTNPIKGRVPFR